jgi:hypothetical protein
MKLRNTFALFVCCLVSIKIALALEIKTKEKVTVILWENRDCDASDYLGGQLKLLLNGGDEMNLDDPAKVKQRRFAVPEGIHNRFRGKGANLSSVKFLALTSSRCDKGLTWLNDAVFWEAMSSRRLKYVIQDNVDMDGFIWNIVKFRNELKEYDEVLIYLMMDVCVVNSEYHILSSDTYRYFSGISLSEFVSLHGYPLKKLIANLQGHRPAELSVIIDGDLCPLT